MKARATLWLLVVGVMVACGSPPGRPVGLPPPEYQEPSVEPWPPPSAPSAAASADPAAVAPASAPPPPGLVGGSVAPAASENVGGSGATLPPGTP